MTEIPRHAAPDDGALALRAMTGGNFAIRSATFAALRGFADARAGEDVDLAWRAARAGVRLGLAPGAVVQRRFRSGTLATARQFFVYGRGDAWVYRRHRRAGMRRAPLRDALHRYGLVARMTPGALRATVPRRHWALLAGVSAGRLAGSARHRVLYL